MHRRFWFHQNDVVLATKKLRQVREIASELSLVFRRGKPFASNNPRFGQWIEHKHGRGAAFRLRENVQIFDEIQRQSGKILVFLGLEEPWAHFIF